MGLLNRFRHPAARTWRPPSVGACCCESHIDDLLEAEIPLAEGKRRAFVADLMLHATLKVSPSVADQLYLETSDFSERRGPFHWWVESAELLERFLSPDAPVSLDDALYVQPGIETVLRVDAGRIAVGAPRMCRRGIQSALVQALLNPRVRSLSLA